MSNSDQLSQKIERDVRYLIGDLHMQILVLRAVVDLAQQPDPRQDPRPGDQPGKPAPPPGHPDEPQPEPEPKPPSDPQPPRRANGNGSAIHLKG